jgi:hypothetical protein
MLSARQRSYALAARWRDHAGSWHLIFTLVDSENQQMYTLGKSWTESSGRRRSLSIANWVVEEACGRRNSSTASCGLQNPSMLSWLPPRQSRSAWFGLPMRGLGVDLEASGASIRGGRAASLRPAEQPRRLSLRERHTRSSSFSGCAAPPFHDASNCFWINPAS